MKPSGILSILLLAALTACQGAGVSQSHAVASSAPASSTGASASRRAAMIGTWACRGTYYGRTSMRFYYLALHADGTGTVQIKTPRTQITMPLSRTPWWNYGSTVTMTWYGSNHWQMTNFPAPHGRNLVMDWIRQG